MTNSKKKQSSRQKRVLVASIVLAGLIVAGGTFAWFTSKDEVTNKLTASNNYGVSIVENFTPPTDWTPGQDVNKDVSVTNTGNVDAFVKVTLSNTLDITTVSAGGAFDSTNTANYVTLSTTEVAGDLPDTQPESADEVKAVQAGGRVVCKAGTVVESENEEIEEGTDFKPTDTGLYVFEKDSKVNENGVREYTYDGYYFVAGKEGEDGTYYDIDNISKTTTDNVTTFEYAMKVTSSEVGKNLTFDYSGLTAADKTNIIKATYNADTEENTDDDIVINIKLDDDWTTNWTFDSTNNAFYYNDTVKAGKTSEKLIDSIELDSSVSNEAYQSFEYNLKVTADSVQVVKNEAGEDTNEAIPDDWLTATLSLTDGVTSSISWS